jgi:hypothetical protein
VLYNFPVTSQKSSFDPLVFGIKKGKDKSALMAREITARERFLES